MIRRLKRYADMDGVRRTMCHNDINIDNVLLTEDTLDIITQLVLCRLGSVQGEHRGE